MAALPVDTRTLVVLTAAGDAAAVLRGELSEIARIAKERDVTELVLAAPGLAAAGGDGPRPAELLADVLGLTVVAPDGAIALLPDGTLKTKASWWRCAPAQPSTRLGDTWPEPQAVSQECPVVTEIAGGYWITTAPSERPPGVIGDAGAGASTMTVVVGSPQAPTVHRDRLAEIVGPLAGRGAQVVLSAPWAAPAPLYDMTARLTAHLGEEVLVSLGLPMPGGSDGRFAAFRSLGLQGGFAAVYLDADGNPAWEPYLTKLTAWREGRRVVPIGWRRPFPGATCVGPAVFEAFPGWELEAVPCGLWLRQVPEEGTAKDRNVRFRAADHRLPVLMVGAAGRTLPADIWENVGELLSRLPRQEREPLGLMLRGTADTASREAARRTARAFDLELPAPGAKPDTARARHRPSAAAPTPAPSAALPDVAATAQRARGWLLS
ncbi:hypothetical protein ACF07Y_36890 [Streptomyces sp. NPDC016566]|uniref:hypothetical protein n=1 Tax=Streptomyces sp. NPDC016566 TaxID=3364967 RepID=UPI0036FFC865